jgi:hypothetical protein
MFTCSITKKEFEGLCSYQLKQVKQIEHKAICGNRCNYYRKVIVSKQEIPINHEEKTEPIPIKDMDVFTRYPSFLNVEYFKYRNRQDLDNQIREYLDHSRAYITETDIDTLTFLGLRMKEESFQKTKNPIYAIEGFLLAKNANLYPPFWVLEWLSKGFEEYYKSNGRKPIDQLLGFTGRVFKKLIEEDRDEWLMINIWRLTRFCGFNEKIAAKMVSQNLKNTPGWNKTGLKIRTPDGSTLTTKYSAGGWQHKFDSFNGFVEMEEKRFKDKKWKGRFLKSFKKR